MKEHSYFYFHLEKFMDHTVIAIQDFLSKLGVKPRMHLEESIVFLLSKFQNEFMKASVLPKYEPNIVGLSTLYCVWWLQHWKINLKIRLLWSLRRSLIILVGLTMTWYSEKMMVSTMGYCGFMPHLHKNLECYLPHMD